MDFRFRLERALSPAYHEPMRYDRSRGSTWLTVGLLALGWSCGGEEQPADEPAPTEDAPASVASELPSERGPAEPQPVTLEAVNQSGVEGRATAIEKDDSIQFNLMVQGLPGAGEYAAHIHRGSCQTGGDVLVTLQPVHAEGDGMGRSMTTLRAGRLSGSGGHFVQVQGKGGVLACGDVPAPAP
jgi:hypothetical protein